MDSEVCLFIDNSPRMPIMLSSAARWPTQVPLESRARVCHRKADVAPPERPRLLLPGIWNKALEPQAAPHAPRRSSHSRESPGQATGAALRKILRPRLLPAAACLLTATACAGARGMTNHPESAVERGKNHVETVGADRLVGVEEIAAFRGEKPRRTK